MLANQSVPAVDSDAAMNVGDPIPELRFPGDPACVPACILIVDDEERMCASLAALLSRAGYNVEATAEAEGALQWLKTRTYDLVIADIKMPGVDGLELLRVARQADPDALVILMTGYGSLDSAVAAIGSGAYDYLLKPIEFPALELVVKRAFEKRRADLSRRALLAELQAKNELLSRKFAQLDALYQAARSLAVARDLDELLVKIVTLATEVIGARVGSIMLVEPETQGLVVKAALGLEPEIVRTTRLPFGSSIAGYVAQRSEPVVVADVETDSRFARVAKAKYETKSLLCAPLVVKQEVLGVINLADKRGGGVFGPDDLQLLVTFASQVAVAIDDARQIEQALQNARRLVTMGSLLSEISHDLKAPLTNIRGSLQILREKLARSPEAAEILKATEGEVYRLTELVKELVDFSNPNKYHLQRADLSGVIRRALKLVESDLAKKKIDLRLRMTADLPPIFLNENELIEMLLNLITNAFEGMPDGGILEVGAQGEQGDVRVWVKDSGAGISPERLPRIFERYYTTKPTGTGLGLPIVERIVKAHNGTITVESTPGKGTTFAVTFPGAER